jgi:hypothetical protein
MKQRRSVVQKHMFAFLLVLHQAAWFESWSAVVTAILRQHSGQRGQPMMRQLGLGSHLPISNFMSLS